MDNRREGAPRIALWLVGVLAATAGCAPTEVGSQQARNALSYGPTRASCAALRSAAAEVARSYSPVVVGGWALPLFGLPSETPRFPRTAPGCTSDGTCQHYNTRWTDNYHPPSPDAQGLGSGGHPGDDIGARRESVVFAVGACEVVGPSEVARAFDPSTSLCAEGDTECGGRWGNLLVLRCSADVPGGEIFVAYAHLKEVCVSPGDHVVAGQPVAISGSTGDSSGPHLHFQVERRAALGTRNLRCATGSVCRLFFPSGGGGVNSTPAGTGGVDSSDSVPYVEAATYDPVRAIVALQQGEGPLSMCPGDQVGVADDDRPFERAAFRWRWTLSLGCPVDRGGGPLVHDVRGLRVQDFAQPTDDAGVGDAVAGLYRVSDSVLIYNPRLPEETRSTLGRSTALLIRGGFWGTFRCLQVDGEPNGGAVLLGAPRTEEYLYESGTTACGHSPSGVPVQRFERGCMWWDNSHRTVRIHLDTPDPRLADAIAAATPCLSGVDTLIDENPGRGVLDAGGAPDGGPRPTDVPPVLDAALPDTGPDRRDGAAADGPAPSFDAPPSCGGPHRMVCGGVCADTWSNATHCGRCGNVCPAGTRCDLGACATIDPCAGVRCSECQTCRGGVCAPVTDHTPCSSTRECRGGACVAPCAANYCETLRYNSGIYCDNRAIVGCTAQPSGCRAETSRVICPTDCVAGRCLPCPANFADCDGNPATGCEADLRTSPNNCGTCGLQCPGARACHGGICDGSARKLALGNTHSCALTTLGTAQCWGENIAGELGSGAVFPLHNELTPVGVVDLVDATDLAGARTSTCAIRAGGRVVCWGHNDRGQLGTGSMGMWTSHFVPTTGVTSAWQITAGWDHVCVATTADTVMCWGLNLDGRLGDGTTTTRTSPVSVAGITNVLQVEAGPMDTCVVRRDGTAACWGFGSTGRLGTGSTADQYRPAPMVGVTNATAVACGRYTTCVLRTDATVACTGGSPFGNGGLGDGTTAQRNTVATVPGLTNVVHIAMGDDHACALRRDGTVWCWGRNNFGQLGEGTTMTRLSPTLVPGLTGVLQIDAGGYHTCALLVSGRIVCWGDNEAGQLGDGTRTSRSTPVSVVLR